MKLNNHKNNFVAETFAVNSKKNDSKIKKSKKKKTDNTQLRLKKK